MKKKSPEHIRARVVRSTVALFAAVFFSLTSFAQEQSRISGIVYDPSGEPLVGATVVEQGTMNGTSTNNAGHFNLRVSSPNAELTVSFLGMRTVTIKATPDKNMNVHLETDATMLDEVIAIGYGTAKKSDLTGSVASLGADIVEDKMVVSVEDALRGRVAGVSIASGDGQPGEGMNVRIRGIGSLNASNAPLYVVDGVPIESPDISTNDIESMEILKDASATAIYGSRGANGVIIITTKAGFKGKAVVNLQYNGGYKTPVRLISMMNNWQYVENTARIRLLVVSPEGSGVIPTNPNPLQYADRDGNLWYFPRAIESPNWRDVKADPSLTPNTDWQDVMMRNTWTHNAKLTISGGSDETKYSLMGSLLKNEGMVIYSGDEKYSARFNLKQKVSSKIDLDLGINASRSKQRGAITDDMSGTLMNMLTQHPTRQTDFTEELETEEGYTNNVNNNPWFQARNIVRHTVKDNMMGKVGLNWMITRTLRLNITGSYSYNDNTRIQYVPSTVRAAQTEIGRNIDNSTKKYNWVNDNLLYFTPKAMGKHKFDLMGGISIDETNTKKLVAEAQNFQYELLREGGMNYGLNPINPTKDEDRTRMFSYLARGNYNYDDRYLFTATFRADGSSRFGKDNKWAVFPSAAFSWRASQEQFLRSQRWLSNLKFRASAGMTGNTNIPAYQTLPMTETANSPMNRGNDQLAFGLVTSRIANPSLKWETSIQYDAGVDFGLFKNRINGVIDLYYKQTRDLLLRENVSPSIGYTTRWSNIGAVDNKGLEITLNAYIIQTKGRKGFNWDVSYNMSFNRSKVVSLGNVDQIILANSTTAANNFAVLQVGKSIGSWFGYRTAGLYRNYQELYALPDNYSAHGYLKPTGTIDDAGRTLLIPGMTRYVDQNGDGLIGDDDRVILGCGQPKFTGGIQNNFRYKQWGLFVNMEFSYGNQIFNSTALATQTGGKNNQTRYYWENSWGPDLFDKNSGKPVWQGNEEGFLPISLNNAGTYYNYLKDVNLEDGSYLRISDINLAYSFDKNITKKLRINNLKLFAGVRNLWLFTKYRGYDPDVSTVSGTMADLIPSVDNASYPRSREFYFGVNVSF